MNKKVVIEARNLTKIYTIPFSSYRVKALDNFNLQIYQGEVFGLLGPNGSGKTTALKIFLGLIFPTSGEALVLGKSPQEVAIKDRIGFLPEESYLYRFLNADETLNFYGRLFKIPRIERKKKINELIDLLGLSDARRRPVREYSRGMARRLGLAQALINDPDVIFLDEPTSGLDPLIARQIKDLILNLKQAGKTIVLSSHLLADVQDVCDRILILHNGVIQKIGQVKDLLNINDSVQVTIKSSLNETNRIRSLIEKLGLEITDIRSSTESLETLFLKTIKPSEKSED